LARCGYYDPAQFEASGGLLGRLLSLQRQQGMLPDPDLDLPSAGFQPTTSPPPQLNASEAASAAQNLQAQLESLRAALAGGNAVAGIGSLPPGSSPIARPPASQPQAGGAQPAGPE